MTAILDCFRIALENCGNETVKFTTGGQLKRRKSRSHNLDLPGGMQRNLSESHLVQAGSKAVSNVAEQFSKLGQSLNPKILTGRKTANNTQNDVATTNKPEPDDQTDKDNEIPAGTECVDAVESAPVFNDNSFLQSVGIVMVDAGELSETKSHPKSANKSANLENVSRMSISSVTDNVIMPPELLDLTPDNFSVATAPEINVQETETDGKTERNNSSIKMCHSVADMRSGSTDDDDGSRYVVHHLIEQNI